MKQYYACAALLSGAWILAGAQAPSGPRAREVIVVFKTHFDIGFTEFADHVVNRYRTSMIDKALDLVDQSRNLPPEHQFVWTVPGWPLKQILWEGQTSERRERVVAAIRAGRLAFHALPFTTHTESLDLEDLVRGLGFSSALARSMGQPLPRDAKMTDVPEHTWIIPTILRRAGVEFLHIGCNGMSSPPDVPDLFWWEGPDGSRLLTMNTGKSYGTGLVPPAGWPYKTWLALMMTGDNQGPPTSDAVNKLLAQAARDLPGVRIRLGRLSDFSDAIRTENASIPVVRADMPDTWIHGIMSLPAATRLARNIRPQIGAAEALARILRFWGIDAASPDREIARAYEQSLLYGEHTWGMHSVFFGHRYGEEWRGMRARGHYAKLEQSWDDHRAYARNSAAISGSVLNYEMQTLAQRVGVEGRRIVVYNPLPWKRDAVVTGLFRNFSEVALRDAASGEMLPVSRTGPQFRFVARDLPAMGYRTYVPLAAKGLPAAPGLMAEGKTIENEFLRVTLDPARGGVSSVVEKRRGRELVQADSPYAFGQYLYERFDADRVAAFTNAYLKNPKSGLNDFGKLNLPPAAAQPYAAATARDCSLKVDKTATAAEALLTCAPRQDLSDQTVLRVSLYLNLPFVDLEWGIAGKTEDPWPEAGWLALPVRAGTPKFRLGRLGSIVDPAKETVRSSNQDQYCVNTGVAVIGADDAGAIVCPLDSPLVSLGAPGGWKYSREFRAQSSSVFVNLFNNQWSTNFALWSGGAWTSRVRVWAAEGHSVDRAMIVNSWEARQPAQAAIADGPKGVLPLSASGLEVSMPGILVTALGANPDGAGTILRLWEQAGGRGVCRVRLPRAIHGSVQPVDLRGRPAGNPLPVKAGEVAVPVEPFAPVTLLIND